MGRWDILSGTMGHSRWDDGTLPGGTMGHSRWDDSVGTMLGGDDGIFFVVVVCFVSKCLFT